jgi:hypothetical protein
MLVIASESTQREPDHQMESYTEAAPASHALQLNQAHL